MAEKEESKYWIGFDLGGTKMQVKVFDDHFQTLGKERRKTKGHEGVSAGVKRIAETVRTALEEAGILPGSVSGMGMGVPGPLDLEAGIIEFAPNLGWKKVPLRDLMEKELGIPVVIANDVDMGVYGEYQFGAAQESRCVLGIFPGTGIGGGCIYEGQILRGKTASCFEIGHVQAIPNGPLCGCGKKGCLEAVASRLATAAAAAAAAYRGDAPHLMQEAGTDLANIRSGALAKSIAAGDVEIENIVRLAASHMGRVIGSVINLLAPDTVVLGGGMIEAMPDLHLEEVRKGSLETVLSSFQNSYCVVTAALGDDATTMGAAAWAKKVLAGT
jgi:glucokinase